MAHPGKKSDEGSEPTSTGSRPAKPSELSQIDFEIEFFGAVLKGMPDYVDVLRVMGNNLTRKGRYNQGLQIDKRLIELRPDDALAHYNLACSYALTGKPDHAIKTLRKAVELGYCDFRYMREDRDLESIHQDPRFRQLLREFENC